MSDEERRHLEHLERELAPLLSGSSCTPDAYGHCITCADEALPARVVSVDQDAALAHVTLDGRPIEIDVSLIDTIIPGDWLLVHGGVAIAKL